MAMNRWTICLLAFASNAAAQPIVGGVATPVTYSVNDEPTLSPDGKRMIFIKFLEGREQLFIANADGSAERQLTHDNLGIEDPAWSPDGRQVAFVRLEHGKNAMYVMSIDGSGQRRVTPPTQSPIHPAWMPDGRSILY